MHTLSQYLVSSDRNDFRKEMSNQQLNNDNSKITRRSDKVFVEENFQNAESSNYGKAERTSTEKAMNTQLRLSSSPLPSVYLPFGNEYLSVESTMLHNAAALRERNVLTLNSESDVFNPFLHDENSLAIASSSNNFVLDGPGSIEQQNHNLYSQFHGINFEAHRKRRFSASSLPVSTISAFSAFTTPRKPETKSPKRSICRLLLNSSIMFGREFCYAVEGGLTTPILLSIGLPLNMYSLVWVISPVLGFILQPILGSMSDRCTSSWGRRRPFILALAIILLIGLTLFLNGEQFVGTFAARDNIRRNVGISSYSVAAIALTVTGVVVFDFSADFIEGPIRAYTMDVCDEEDIKRSFLYQAIFTGAGGAFGYASGGVSWTRDTALRRFFPSDRQVIYIACAFIFVLCTIFNLTSIPEHVVAVADPGGIWEMQPLHHHFKPPCFVLFTRFCLQKIAHNSINHDQSITAASNKNVCKIQKNKEISFRGQMAEKKEKENIDAGIKPERKILNAPVAQNSEQLFKKQEKNLSVNHTKHLAVPTSLNARSNQNKLKTLNKQKNASYVKTKPIKKRKKKLRYFHSSKKARKYSKSLITKHSHSYGTFGSNSNNQKKSLASSNSSSQVQGPFSKLNKITLDKNINQWKGYNKFRNDSTKVENLNHSEDSYDTDTDSSEHSTVTSFHYYPYAAVDPAFKNFQSNTQNRRTLSTRKKVIYPDTYEEETAFSDSFSCVSDGFKLNEDKMESERENKLKSLVNSIKTMPKELRFLCLCHLLGWVAFLSIALFFTDFVGQVVMKGDPRAPPSSRLGQLYFRGVEIGNWGLTINSAISSLYCFLLKIFIRKLGFRVIYVAGYITFSLGVGFIALFPSTNVILVLSSVIGVMSATLYTIPYVLVAQYHEGYKNSEGSLRERGVGVDCALVTCVIQLAQIITGLGIGALVNLVGTVTVTVVTASVAGCLATFTAAFLVKY